MAEEDELIVELSELLIRLTEEGHLELVSRRGAMSLAVALLAALEKDNDVNVGEWLLERPEVAELYLDPGELAPMLAGVLARMASDEPVHKHDPELCAAILASPGDLQARQVYADWLTEKGDPRGELIVVQAQRETATGKERKRLERVEAALLGRYRRHFFGDLDGAERELVHFRYGFFDKMNVVSEKALEQLLSLESARFLRQLGLDPAPKVIEKALAKRTLPTALVGLRIGRHLADGILRIGRATRGLSRLERLEISAHTIVLDDLALPGLRALSCQASELRVDSAASLSRLEGLESLQLVNREFGNRDAAYKARLCAWLFDAPPPRLASLHLDLGNASRADWLGRLLESPLARQLRSLDLSNTSFDANDLKALLARAPSLTKLERADLRATGLHSNQNAAARGLCETVLLGPLQQRELSLYGDENLGKDDVEVEAVDNEETDDEYDEDDDEDEDDEDEGPGADEYEEPAYDEDDRTADDGTESNDTDKDKGKDDDEADEDEDEDDDDDGEQHREIEEDE